MKVTLTAVLPPSDDGDRLGVHTADVFRTHRPWPVVIDLAALTARRAQLMAREDERTS